MNRIRILQAICVAGVLWAVLMACVAVSIVVSRPKPEHVSMETGTGITGWRRDYPADAPWTNLQRDTPHAMGKAP